MAPRSEAERQARTASRGTGASATPGGPSARRRPANSAAREAGRSSAVGAGGRPGARERTDPARRAAFDVLLAVDQRDAYANLLLPAVIHERGLTGRDAALATELTYGTLRGRGTYDAIIGVCSDRGLDRIDPPLREVLRLGLHQLLATRVRAHAAVATSVDLAKDVAGTRSAGFVNAVLRRVATRDMEAWIGLVAPSPEADPVGHLAVRYSHPRWIVAALSQALGEPSGGQPAGPSGGQPGGPSGGQPGGPSGGQPGAGAAAGLAETEAALAAGSARPRVTLSVVPGLADPAELVTGGGELTRWSPFGAHLDGGDPAAVAAVSEGRAAVQDEASQLAALALVRAEVTGRDHRWLDMCAGPGGKARILAGLAADRGARLVAADKRVHRARLASAAVTATGAAAAVTADGTAPPWLPGTFDRVLADVPCSGLGALRRRPEARWRKSPEDVAGLRALQRGLLTAALDAVRPGGVVGYVTCSPHLAETRAVVGDVLRGRADAEVLDAPGVLPEVPGLRCPAPDNRFAQFWPHRHGTDAIFLALLRRRD
jgi:16S rRNA (cytosine967-C5)-methyltransferase